METLEHRQRLAYVYIVGEGKVLLGRKRRGFGEGLWGGFGGKVDGNESFAQGVLRELREECGLLANEEDLTRAGTVRIKRDHVNDTVVNMHIVLYRLEESAVVGDPAETDEMSPAWREIGDIPYADMLPDVASVLPRILDGEHVDMRFIYNRHGECWVG